MKREAPTTPRRSSRRVSVKQESPSSIKEEESPELETPKRVKTQTPKTTPKTPKTPIELAAQKLRKLAANNDPYPTYKHPTPQECHYVNDVLSNLHGKAIRPLDKAIDDTSIGSACGAVPDVIDALVRTILSQNTTSKNSTLAKRNMDAVFGKSNWKAVHEASHDDVEESIRVAGLAPSKTITIKAMLSSTLEKYGDFTLNHLHDAKSNDEVIEELIQFRGVGPKTASCVALFCTGRDSFAVDTHVFRLTKQLRWIPPSADREKCFGHLDVRIPDELKYSLHVLLIQHGKTCGFCSAHKVKNMLDPAKCPLRGIKRANEADVKEGGEMGVKEEEEEVKEE